MNHRPDLNKVRKRKRFNILSPMHQLGTDNTYMKFQDLLRVSLGYNPGVEEW